MTYYIYILYCMINSYNISRLYTSSGFTNDVGMAIAHIFDIFWPWQMWIYIDSAAVCRGYSPVLYYSAKVEIPIEYEHIYIYICGYFSSYSWYTWVNFPSHNWGKKPSRDLETNVRKAVNPFWKLFNSPQKLWFSGRSTHIWDMLGSFIWRSW